MSGVNRAWTRHPVTLLWSAGRPSRAALRQRHPAPNNHAATPVLGHFRPSGLGKSDFDQVEETAGGRTSRVGRRNGTSPRLIRSSDEARQGRDGHTGKIVRVRPSGRLLLRAPSVAWSGRWRHPSGPGMGCPGFAAV